MRIVYRTFSQIVDDLEFFLSNFEFILNEITNAKPYLGGFSLIIMQKHKMVESECVRSSQQRCSVKELFLEILQNSQENTCARVSFLVKLPKGGSSTGVFL